MHRTEMVIYFVQEFFQQNVSGSVYTGCKRPLCCVFVWVKMFKVGCRRPVTDTGSGLFGLDRVGGERILNLSLSLWISLEIVGSALQKMLALATGEPD